jgi:hypothetical protein
MKNYLYLVRLYTYCLNKKINLELARVLYCPNISICYISNLKRYIYVAHLSIFILKHLLLMKIKKNLIEKKNIYDI